MRSESPIENDEYASIAEKNSSFQQLNWSHIRWNKDRLQAEKFWNIKIINWLKFIYLISIFFSLKSTNK